MQTWLLPKLLAASYTDKEKTVFNEALVLILKHLTSDKINDQIKEKIKLYLSSSHALTDNNAFDFESLEIGPININRRKLLNNILSQTDYYKMAVRLNHLDDDTLSLLSPIERKNLLKQFNESIRNTSNEQVKHELILAISHLPGNKK